MDPHDSPPPRRGRGAGENPPNRYERLHVVEDPAELEDEELRQVPTEFFVDDSRSILSENDSPDVPFDYSINPYRGCEHGCIYCYSRPTHEYLGFSAGLDFESKILVKKDAPDLLRKEFETTSWVPQVVAVSGSTDAYQPAERELEITRGCLEVFLEARNPVSIITKNELVTRDADLLAELAEDDLVHVTLSITSLRDEVVGAMEPRTSRPERRLKAVEELAERGVPVGVNVAPVIPGLTDEEIPRILEAARERGARRAGWVMLRLPGPVEDLFVDWLEREFPERKEKVLNRLRSIREGKLSDSEFGRRMRGEGLFADTVSSLFELTCRRLGLNEEDRSLRTDLFRRPSLGQQELF